MAKTMTPRKRKKNTPAEIPPFALYREEGDDRGKEYRFSTADGALNKAKQEKWQNFSIYEGLRCITRVVSVPSKNKRKPLQKRKKPLKLTSRAKPNHD